MDSRSNVLIIILISGTLMMMGRRDGTQNQPASVKGVAMGTPKDHPGRPVPGLTRRVFMASGAFLALMGVGIPARGAIPGKRTASTNQTRSIHSGHSLTDSYIHSGPWPGTLRKLAESIGIHHSDRKLVKSTIPGSPISWRWHNSVPDLRPGDPTADARLNIADFDTLVITEGGPPPRVGQASDSAALTDTLDYLCRFIANAIERGNDGNGALDIILWSIWPSLTMWRPDPPEWTGSWREFEDFRAALPEYGRSFRFMADYASWKMRELYPSLPEGWRVWLFPGHLWMARVWDDIRDGTVPHVNAMQDLFGDDIHTNDTGGYGLACLMLACLYQVDLGRQPRLHRPRDIPEPLQEYFTRISWEVATSYAPVGMNGKQDTAPVWDAASMSDPLPGWTPARLREAAD